MAKINLGASDFPVFEERAQIDGGLRYVLTVNLFPSTLANHTQDSQEQNTSVWIPPVGRCLFLIGVDHLARARYYLLKGDQDDHFLKVMYDGVAHARLMVASSTEVLAWLVSEKCK